MKKVIFTLFTLFSFIYINAQVLYEENGSDMARWNHAIDSLTKWRVQNHIIGVRTYCYKPDSTVISGYLATEVKYDNNGNIAEYTTLNKRGKIETKFIEKWNDKNQYVSYIALKRNGKFHYGMSYVYNAEGDEIERKIYWDKPTKMVNHGFMKYDEKHNMIECRYLMKNDKKTGYKYEYGYYPDGSKKQTIEYNPKGKIVHQWDYDCSSVGKLALNKLKDTSKLCIRFEKDQFGNQVKIKEEFARNGQVVRTIKKYDSNENQLEEIRYNKRGLSIFHTINIFNATNHLTEQKEFAKNDSKLKSRKVFYYNSDGKASQMIEYKSDNKPKQIVKYEVVKG